MFIDLANHHHHQTIMFTAEMSTSETTFLDTIIYNGERFRSENILDIKTHFKTTETFQYTYFSTCHPKKREREVLLKGKHSDFSAQTLLKLYLKRT